MDCGAKNASNNDDGSEENLWNKLVARKDIWNDDDETMCETMFLSEAGDQSIISEAVETHLFIVWIRLKSYYSTLHKYPFLLLVSLLSFCAFSACGFTVVYSFSSMYCETRLHAANSTALEAGEWFADEFRKALLPLFTLQQLVKHDEMLKNLTARIGNRGQAGAAPDWPGRDGYRDVRDICDDKKLVDHFNGIAKDIKKDSGLGKVIPSLRLAPAGVMCLIYPLVNEEDFENGYHNTTKFLYNDWVNDSPFHTSTLRRTLDVQNGEEAKVTVTGPYQVESSSRTNKTIISESLFFTHLGVNLPGSKLTVDGMDYHSWGMIVMEFNWDLMVKESGIVERLEERGLIFRLDREAPMMNRTDNKYYLETHTIAQSDRNSEAGIPLGFKSESSVMINKIVNGDKWIMMVGYEDGCSPPFANWGYISVALISFIGSLMLMIILVEKHQHKELLYKMMPLNAIKKLNRGQTVVEKYNLVTIFFSDIVDFTNMSGKMRPIEIMRMLNALYVKFDKLVEKHNLYKVETIGDAYMVVGGAPDRCSSQEGADKIARFALDCIECVKYFRTIEGSQIYIRAGIASGPVVAGVVGDSMPRYCFFGDTVNFASRMESTSEKMKIQCSELTYNILRNSPSSMFKMEQRRSACGRLGIEVKGKGWLQSWWIKGVDDSVNDTLNQESLTVVVEPSLESTVKRENSPTWREYISDGVNAVIQSSSQISPQHQELVMDDECKDNLYPDGELTGGDIYLNSKPLVRFQMFSGEIGRRNSLVSNLTDDFTKDGFSPKKKVRLFRKTQKKMENHEDRITYNFCDEEYTSSYNHDGTQSDEIASKYKLLQPLIAQPWAEIGQGSNPLSTATSNTDAMVDRICSILEYRLEKACCSGKPADHVVLTKKVRNQLRHYVSKIESRYRTVHYHSFGHASHVVISVNKLLEMLANSNNASSSDNHNFISKDKMAHFALLFAALVHDVCHNGLSNEIMIREKDKLALRYNNTSILERNSTDVALDLLNKSCYHELTRVLFPSPESRAIFETILQTTILSTDIACKEQMHSCISRWSIAFSEESGDASEAARSMNGAVNVEQCDSKPLISSDIFYPSFKGADSGNKSRVVLEHLLQMADVAHLMQEWPTFIKWNYRLFKELFSRHKAGLTSKPSQGWAEGQISFFDGYVLPLATRMSKTGLLGSRGAEIVQCALENRRKWLQDGDKISAVMLSGLDQKQNEDHTLSAILAEYS